MIKKISEELLEKLIPNLSKEDKKWINVFNEFQYRNNVLLEGLVSWQSLGLFLEQLRQQGLGYQYELYPIRYKIAIYQSYIYIELNNLLDVRGKSSIVTFINTFSKDLHEESPKVKSIFKSNVNIGKLDSHFKFFNEWLAKNKEEVDHIKYMRDKNYSHIDHDFEYGNKISYEYMISTIVFISDYLSALPAILDFSKYRVIKGEIVAGGTILENNISKSLLDIRFKKEINQLVNNHNFSKKDKKAFLLNCYDSIAEILKEVKLIKF